MIGCEIISLDSVSSTNDVAFKLAIDGAKEGTVIFAKEQTKGRGRFGRSWSSSKGEDILMSVILRPGHSQIGIITAIGAIAVIQAVKLTCKMDLKIRFPNDVVVNNKKLAGILVESRFIGESPDIFIVGIGVNVNSISFPDEFKAEATSIKLEIGKNTNINVLQKAIVEEMDRYYREMSVEKIRAFYSDHSSITGKLVSLMEQGKELRGVCEQADPVDGILLRLDSGYTRRIRPELAEMVRLV